MSSLPDDPADNVAQNFKEQGNNCFKGKWYREALGFYTQDARPDDARLKEALLLTRVTCNPELPRKLRVGIARLRNHHHGQFLYI